METDIAIVGASAAGLLAACRLASAGRDVVVFERSLALEPLERSLIVTHKMEDLLGSIGNRSVKNHIDRFEMYANGKVGEIKLGKPDLIIERSILIEDLARQAMDAGAKLELGSRLVGLNGAGGGIRLDLKQGGQARTLTASKVIGADGAQSDVARLGGWPPVPLVSLIQAIIATPSDIDLHTSRIWFRPQDTPFFYWFIPECSDRGALGVIGEDAPNVKGRLDAFLAEKGMTPLGYQAALIPAYKRWVKPHKKLGKGDVYLVGDAAAQVKVSTVGGIVTGFRGAEAIVERILTGSRRELRPLRRELNLHLLIHKSLRRFSQEDYIHLLDQLSPEVKRSITVRSRDDAGRILLSLMRTRPSLLLRGMGSLVGRRALNPQA
jgi:flavin-dependent dehydrogenase